MVATKKQAKKKPEPKKVVAVVKGTKPQLVAEAKKLDTEIRRQVAELARQAQKLTNDSLEVGKLLIRMRDKQLHKYILNPASRKGYVQFSDYVDDVFKEWKPKGFSRSTIFNYMQIAGLLEGPHAIPEDTVRQMPAQTARAIAQLKPEIRREVAERVKDLPTKEALPKVQEAFNMSVPPDERRELKVGFHRNWAPEVVKALENILSVGIYIRDIRDGDRTMTLEEKTVMAMCAEFWQFHEEEIKQGVEEAKAREQEEAAGAEELDEENNQDEYVEGEIMEDEEEAVPAGRRVH